MFVARDLRLDRRVVIKLLRPELSAGVSAERFRREIRTAASLQHALIVPVLDVGDLNGLPYFLMPFVDGESLRSRLHDGPLSVVDTVRILRDVARALAAAHAKGVVHRDIKPDNVLLSGDAAVVADFGVSKAFAKARHEEHDASGGGPSITTVGVSLGTPAYMAPEQVAADPAAGAAMDLYAFGVMAYEMLTGKPPFTDRAPQAIMAAHITELPVPLGSVRPELPTALTQLVMRCLEKDPAARYESAAAIVALLEDPTVLSGSFTPIPDDVAAAITGTQPLLSSALASVASVASVASASPASRASSASDASVRMSAGSAAKPSRAQGAALALVLGVALTSAVAWFVTTKRGPDAAISDARALGALQREVPLDTSPSVAVMPFVYLGADSTQKFLAQAIGDAVTDGLARVAGLRVSSRSSAEALQRRLVSDDTARFPVRTIVEGVVEQEGTTVRLTVRLVNAANGFTLFADRIEGERANLFALEDAIASAMRERLASHFALSDSPPVRVPVR